MSIIAQPAGDLDRADVVALAMMGTAFGNEDRVAVLQLFQGRDAADGRFQQALVPGHEDGERRQAHVHRRIGRHFGKDLTVRNDQGRLLAQTFQRMAQFIFLDDDSRAVVVDDFPDSLLLRQDEAPFRRCRIDGDDEDDEIAALDEVAHDRRCRFDGLQAGQALFEFVDAFSLQGADVDFMVLRLEGLVQQVRLIIDDEVRQVLVPDESQDFVVSRRPSFRSIDDDDGYIRLIEDLLRPAHPFLAQGPDIVEARRVDDDHRPQGQEFHSLVDRVRRRPFRRRYDRQVLAGHGVDDTRFPGIAAAKETNMDPFA